MPEGVPGTGSVNPGQLKNLMQLRELVYVPLRDNERSFVEPWFVDAMLNEGYLDLNARLRIKQVQLTGTTSSTGTIPYPSDVVEVMGLWIEADGALMPIQFMGSADFSSWSKPGNNTPAAYLARVFGAVIQTYPALELQDYTLEYVARPAWMEEDTDQPVDIHPELQPRLIAYAQAKAKWQEGENEEGDKYMAMYEAGIPGPPRMLNAIHPESMMFIPEPGPFD